MSNRGRSAFSCVVLLLGALLISGCWDVREPESLAFVVTIAIDRASGSKGYVVTTSIALPSRLLAQSTAGAGGGGGLTGQGGGTSGGGAGRESAGRWEVTGTGRTIADAYRSVQESSSRRLFSGHLQLVIVSEEVARQGLAPVLEFLERNREIRRTINLLVTPGSAQPVLRLSPKAESLVALMIRGAQRWQRFAATGFVSPLRLVSDALASEGEEVLCGRILPTSGLNTPAAKPPTLEEYPGVGSSKALRQEDRSTERSPGGSAGGKLGDGQAGQGGGQADQGVESETEVLLTGSAAFKGDRLVGWLDRRETRGYLLIRNRPFMGMITATLPGYEATQIVTSTNRVHTRRRISMESGVPVIELTTEWTGGIEQLVGRLELSRPGVMSEVERATAAVIAGDMRAALNKAQHDLKTDVFGFGRGISEGRPRDWAKLRDGWDQVYPNLDVRIKVKARIRRVGLPIDPLRWK